MEDVHITCQMHMEMKKSMNYFKETGLRAFMRLSKFNSSRKAVEERTYYLTGLVELRYVLLNMQSATSTSSHTPLVVEEVCLVEDAISYHVAWSKDLVMITSESKSNKHSKRCDKNNKRRRL